MYEVIILGATFAAAGLAQHYKKDCLVIESSHQAGYEFCGTLQDYSGDAYAPRCDAASALQKTLLENPVIHGTHPAIYPYFRDCNILFGTQIVAIREENGISDCTVHGSRGFVTYRAKAVIDTRCSDAMSKSKTYNFLMESPTRPVFSGATCRETAKNGQYLVQCPVALDSDFTDARKAMYEVMKQFTPEQRLILSANVFDYQVRPGYPKMCGGILYLPSKGYQSPVEAMDMGLQMGGRSL